MALDSSFGPRRTDGGAEVVVEPTQAESTLDALVRGIAAVKGVTVSELDPLYDSVDVEALENVLAHAAVRDNDVSATFTVTGCVVTVQSDGPIRIRAEPPDEIPS